ncbi:M16 family metallopeptidase [Actinoallomurus rhizosphaericola]|uniref:M16 family metallopeptidase n=1 Tax=Actinoallomurus rhizosphaericola TaxID=2952536 RepID=UPI00209258BE|nr:M16 family metallopeptidase [Actinoallomurus rhizosphaericola]MCO5997872.1 insulinase family protein [Actinoallomurus rhizosphaericola]
MTTDSNSPARETTTRRITLANGLRVLLRPHPGRATLGVGVHYGVGFRTEPPGRAGFAHLFEHLMFHRGEDAETTSHVGEIERAGGTADGSTHQDHTEYHQHVPPEALDLVLRLEADRMRGPRITETVLRGQVDVVKEEIRLRVLNRPYGGFPWPLLPAVLYRTFPNAHDGYGCFEDLEKVTPQDASDFFDAYYTPGNAVLTLAGRFDPGQAADLVHRHFGDLPPRDAVPAGPLDEPPPEAAIRAHHEARIPAAPAVAIGYRAPDPGRHLERYLAHVVLQDLLTRGPVARLRRRLDDQGAWVHALDSGCGFFGPLDARHPDTLLLTAVHEPAVEADRVIDALDAELLDLADRGPSDAELARAITVRAAGVHRDHDPVAAQARAVGRLEILFGDGTLLDRLPKSFGEVSAEQVAAAAESLRRAPRAVLTHGPTRQGSPRPSRRHDVPLWREPVDRRLPGGLRVVAVPDRSAPLVELRLHLPNEIAGPADAARAELLCRTVLGGAGGPVAQAAETAFGDSGGALRARREREWIVFSGHARSDHLTTLLRVLAEAVADPDGDRYGRVAAERGRVAALAEAGQTMPGRVGQALLYERFFGERALLLAPPRPADLRTVTTDDVLRYHRSVIRPQSATLVMVGDLPPGRMVAAAETALAGWAPSPRPATAPPDGRPPAEPGIEIAAGRTGAEQSHIALLAAGVGLTDPGGPAGRLADLLVGGRPSAPLATAVRERRGLAYHVSTAVDVVLGRPIVQIQAATATATTAETLHAIRELLERAVAEPPAAGEIAEARRYAVGELYRACDSQASLATWLSHMLRCGHDTTRLERLPASLADTPADDVIRMIGELFRPERFTGVVECDPEALAGPPAGLRSSWPARRPDPEAGE